MNPQSLADTLRAWLNGTTASLPLPAGIATLAGRHRLNGTLYHIGASLSELDGVKARESWSRNVAGHLARTSALESIWPKTGPAPLVFKGADIAENLFDDPGARACDDLDLLLPEPQHTAVMNALPPTVGQKPTPRGERFEHDPVYAVGLEIEGLLVELHREPQPIHLARLRGIELYDRGQSGVLGDLNVRFPSPRDRFLLWLTNQAKNAFFSELSALLDLGLILRQLTELDLAAEHRALRALAQSAGLANAYDLALVRLHDSQLWPGSWPTMGPGKVTAINALLPPVWTPLGRPPTARLQVVKTWLCRPMGRPGLLARAAAALIRGERPGGGERDE